MAVVLLLLSKMKYIFKIVLILVPFLGFSQTKGGSITKVSKAKLIQDSLITDLIKDIPFDCKVTGYVYSVRTNKKLFKINCVGNELRLEIQGSFKKANNGDTLNFDKLKTACLEKHKKKYSFIVKE